VKPRRFAEAKRRGGRNGRRAEHVRPAARFFRAAPFRGASSLPAAPMLLLAAPMLSAPRAARLRIARGRPKLTFGFGPRLANAPTSSVS